jgi:small-conductance mechanosensitive channel
MEWIVAAAVVVAAIVIGGVLGRFVTRQLAAPTRPDVLREAAPSVGGLVTSVVSVVGLVVALAVVAPDLLRDVPRQLVAYLPRVLAALVLVIVGRALASAAVIAVDRSTARRPATIRARAALGARVVVLTLFGLLAVGQLGLDTTVVTIGVAAVCFGAAAALTLLVGLGGRQVASEVAAGRSLRRLLRAGEAVTVGDISGTVVTIHPTAVELAQPDGTSLLVPASRFLEYPLTVVRVAAPGPSTRGPGEDAGPAPAGSPLPPPVSPPGPPDAGR